MAPRRAPIPKTVGPFVPVRYGLKGHMTTLAQNPSAGVLYLWCLLHAELAGPRRGLVYVNKRDVAEEFDWSRPRMDRAVDFLRSRPSRSKPYLVRINPGQRGHAGEYYIRNFDGGDPSSHATPALHGHVTPALHGHVTPALHGEALGEDSPCNGSCNASVAWDAKDATGHATPALHGHIKERARLKSKNKKNHKGGKFVDQDRTQNDAHQGVVIEYLFDRIEDLEQHLRTVTFGGLPDEIANDVIAKALQAPHVYGCALRGSEVDEANAPDDEPEDWEEVFE